MDKETMFEMSADALEDLDPISSVFDLSGKVAVISGSGGLALFVINRLLECGAKVVFGARSTEMADLIVNHFKEAGKGDIAFKQTDITKVADCAALVDFAEETFGPVDIVIPVAAYWQPRAFLDVDEEVYDSIIDTDMKGQYFLVQAAARSMVKAGHGGKVVTIASVAYRGEDMYKLAMMTPYNAAKAGVVGMTIGIAKELKQYGINVNCVAPGGMVTPGALTNSGKTVELYGEEFAEAQAAGGHETPVAETPDEMARMIVAMCTNLSDFMYGKVVDVDGGAGLSFQAKPFSYTMEGGIHA